MDERRDASQRLCKKHRAPPQTLVGMADFPSKSPSRSNKPVPCTLCAGVSVLDGRTSSRWKKTKTVRTALTQSLETGTNARASAGIW